MASHAKDPSWSHVCSRCGDRFSSDNALDTLCDMCIMELMKSSPSSILTEDGEDPDS